MEKKLALALLTVFDMLVVETKIESKRIVVNVSHFGRCFVRLALTKLVNRQILLELPL